ncbi:MAG: DUF3499 domain-containing protein [Mycobacteriaceae bacterium]
MKSVRRCCRPGCKNPAIATLTFVYNDSTAVVGPLALTAEPHSWDLCEEHASRITAPKGWELVRYEGEFSTLVTEDDDLTALAEAVREAQRNGAREQPGPALARVEAVSEHTQKLATLTPRAGRRGHLRVLPDPVD